ncbi:glycosyltransferase [Bacteroidota bacterium]
MRKIPIVLGSVLKPVDETRMYEKLGITLAETNNYEVNIIGFFSKKIPTSENICFHPIFDFERTGLSRLLAPFKFFKTIVKLKPELIIVNTPEILLVTVLYKILFGCKIIYDINENYFRNVFYNKHYHPLIKIFLSSWIRIKEFISAPFINYFFLAESGYNDEITFTGTRFEIIENKYKPIKVDWIPQKDPGKIRILYSGTIAESYGVFSTIKFVGKLHQLDPNIELLISGHCGYTPDLKRLKNELKDKPFIKFLGGNTIVPHTDIIGAIQSADFGIVNYLINKSTENCYPTKIYEYMGNKLPILIQEYEPWYRLPLEWDACVVLDFEFADPGQVLNKIKKKRFYKDGVPDSIYWHNEEIKLLKSINRWIRK